MILPLQNINQIEIKDGKVIITYNNKMTLPSKNIKFDINYKNLNNSPEVDHCI